MSEERLYEYKMLRDEIISLMKSQQSLVTFSITVTITILTYAFSADDKSAFIFAVPLLLLLPTTMKLHEQKNDIMDLCSYLAVRGEKREGIYWETMLNKYRRGKVKRRESIITFFQCSEIPMLGITCILLYCREVFFKPLFSQASTNGKIVYIGVTLIIILMDIMMWLLTFDYVNMNYNEIEKRKRKWDKLLDKVNVE